MPDGARVGVIHPNFGADEIETIVSEKTSDQVITIRTKSEGDLSDGILQDTMFEIRVYPVLAEEEEE